MGSKKVCTGISVLVLALVGCLCPGMYAKAGNSLDNQTGGIGSILDPGVRNTNEIIDATAKALNIALEEEKKNTSDLVMANVDNALNVRIDADENAERVGLLYKDCGGTILERKDGWTKIKSGNLVGWASDSFLLFDEDAKELAESVGKLVATVDADALRIRSEASTDASVLECISRGEMIDVIDDTDEKWVCVDYNGEVGYVSAEFVTVDFKIDAGATIEEIKIREAAEAEAKRHVNYGQFAADADTLKLLAALIHCEARGEPYEGQVAVGAVVMNRVRSSAYPNTIYGVIYASGQFTPAQDGKVDAAYISGNINDSCYKAAQEALDGVSNVGDLTHFRRNDGRDGLVIGNHVFY